MNMVILAGRLCGEPELRQTASGVSTCQFRIAVNRRFKDKQTGQYETDFFGCTAWRQTAEFIASHFHKGDGIEIAGSVQNDDYTDKNGVKHYSDRIQVNEAYFPVGGSKASSNVPQGASPASSGVSEIGGLDDFEAILNDDDLPF